MFFRPAAYKRPQAVLFSFYLTLQRTLGPFFWTYLAGVALIALGFADFPLAAFHMKTTNLFADKWIPLVYAWAMGVDAESAILCGRLYDRKGVPVTVTASWRFLTIVYISTSP